MSLRPRGFSEAQVDTRLLDDPKAKRLRKRFPEVAINAMFVYQATVLASWDAGERMTVEDAWPELWLAESHRGAIEAALIECELIDVNGRVPEASWERWYGAAEAHRAKKGDAGRIGGLVKAKNAAEQALAVAETEGDQERIAAAKDEIRRTLARIGEARR